MLRIHDASDYNLNNNFALANDRYEPDSNDALRPALKKMRFDRDCPVQRYNTNSESNLTALITPNQTHDQSNEKPLSSKNIILLDSESIKEEEPIESAWEDALKHAKKTGNANVLLKLIKEELLFERINDLEIEEIMDFGIRFKNRDILLECAKASIPANLRNEILFFAIESKDVELIEVTCDSEPYIPSLRQWCDPFIVMECHKEHGIDPRIVDFLSSYFSLTKANFDEYSWKKYLGAIWNINNKFKLDNYTIDYQGAQVHQFVDRIISSLQTFSNKYPDAVDPDLVKTLITLMERAGIDISDEERLFAFHHHEPILIHAGYIEHHMEIVLKDHILLIGNKGSLSEMPVTAYKIDPNLVNAELFSKIKHCSDCFNEDQAREFYDITLPGMLKGTFHEALSCAFTENWIDEDLEQDGDNCVWESLRTILFAVAGLDAWEKNLCENTTNTKIHERAISKGLQQLVRWDQYVFLHSLEQYIDDSSGDPTAMDRKLVVSILNEAKERMHEKLLDNYHFEEVVAKFVQTRTKAIAIENANDLVMDVEETRPQTLII